MEIAASTIAPSATKDFMSVLPNLVGLDQALKFGDIVKGYILTNAIIEKPQWEIKHSEYSVNVRLPPFSVIVTPCCSIEDKTIMLTPLIEVLPAFFDNPYLAEDLTRVNRIMSPEQAVPPHVWERIGDEEKQRRLAEGNTYAFANLFVYDEHSSFKEYTLNRRTGNISTNYYMIDFRNMYKVHCDRIISASNSPVDSKHLQLSIDMRDDLRVKLARYYSRIPDEDLVEN
jgi:hypothetical protein